MLSHLDFMERRWFVWGFLGEDVDEAWGEDARTAPLAGVAGVTVEDLAGGCATSGSGRRSCWPATRWPRGPAGPRFDDEPPSLAWICFHVLQEYARHAGHLDVAVELAGGELGE